MEEAVAIGNRSDFLQWAIEKATSILSEQGSALAIAARDGTDDDVQGAGAALSKSINEALVEVFDGLLGDEADEL
jgi:hypothetical protein